MKELLLSLFVFMLNLLPLKTMCSISMQEIEVLYTPPTSEEFVILRAAAGMRERKVASAEKGLPNSFL
jgi:hypothetical protein